MSCEADIFFLEEGEDFMSKKDTYYFDQFSSCADSACQAAELLEEVLDHFDAAALKEKLDAMHVIEHDADQKKHDTMNVLIKAFITPIEREDIISLSQNIDNMTDKIEDVLIRIYINNVQTIRPDAVQFTKVIIRCCQAVQSLIREFADFKRSKKLHEEIVRINALEEEADALFISSMRALHTESSDPIEILCWREIFIYLEKCADACEHVADVVESVVMKNS